MHTFVVLIHLTISELFHINQISYVQEIRWSYSYIRFGLNSILNWMEEIRMWMWEVHDVCMCYKLIPSLHNNKYLPLWAVVHPRCIIKKATYNGLLFVNSIRKKNYRTYRNGFVEIQYDLLHLHSNCNIMPNNERCNEYSVILSWLCQCWSDLIPQTL